MTEGIGKALASAIKVDRPPEPGRVRGSLFSNPHRRRIFSALTLAPCTPPAALASGIGISQNSVGWHLDALTEAGYLVEAGAGRAKARYPEGLIGEPEAHLFRMINAPGHAELLRAVIKRPGLSQSELSAELGRSRQRTAGALARLGSAGVVDAVSEGAHMRYYPTRLLPDRAEAAYRHAKDFSEFIVRKIAGEGGLPPSIVKRGLGSMILEAGPGEARFTMDIGINPYITCAACD